MPYGVVLKDERPTSNPPKLTGGNVQRRIMMSLRSSNPPANACHSTLPLSRHPPATRLAAHVWHARCFLAMAGRCMAMAGRLFQHRMRKQTPNEKQRFRVVGSVFLFLFFFFSFKIRCWTFDVRCSSFFIPYSLSYLTQKNKAPRFLSQMIRHKHFHKFQALL